ncbi:hypothetical protein BC629DRAFT_1662937 [Irpex lacteus]|nr:hypothetical protein BC629DRAFT_1662937 [Irpex lacteus]
MAALNGHIAPCHPSPFQCALQKVPARSSTSHPTSADPYHGHEVTAKICTNCLSLVSSANPSASSPGLDLFIAYALHRTRLHTSVTYPALYLRQLKARLPAARGSSGDRLFISAFMLALKVICDDTYLNKSWSIVGRGIHLEWQLNVEPNALKEFEEKVKRDFKGPGPYPSYLMSSPAPSPMPSTTPYASGALTPAPSFVTGHTLPPHNRSVESSYLSPPASPSIPDTPQAPHSVSMSPASSVSPQRPQGQVDNEVQIASPGGIPIAVDSQCVMPKPMHSQIHPQPSARMSTDGVSSRKPKCDLFAYAAPVAW